LANSINHPSTNKDNANDVVRPSQVGKLSINLFINKDIIAIRLNRNIALLEAFAKHLVYKSTAIHSLRDNAR